MKILLRLFLAAVALSLTACDTMQSYFKPKYTISVHVTGSSTDHPRELIPFTFQGRQLLFKKVPEFSQGAFAGFKAFPADNGVGNGVVLRLDAHGRNQLETATRVNQGGLMLTIVNGVPVDIIQIDRPVSDGTFTIWQGISDETVMQMGKKLPNYSSNKSASKWQDMLPSTTKEKREARRAQIEEQKRLDEIARRVERGEDITPAPRSKEIPLE